MQRYDISATDAQRSYLTILVNKAHARHLEIGRWAGLDSRQAIRSNYLTKQDASAWIQHLKFVLAS